MELKVKVKRLRDDAVIPFYAHPSDAGMDLTAVSMSLDDGGIITYGFGLAFEIPEGHVGLVFPRSSVYRKSLDLTNCVGVIDSGYRGEVSAKFRMMPGSRSKMYGIGERVAQMIILPYPKVHLVETEELKDSDRGVGGYGSSGD